MEGLKKLLDALRNDSSAASGQLLDQIKNLEKTN